MNKSHELALLQFAKKHKVTFSSWTKLLLPDWLEAQVQLKPHLSRNIGAAADRKLLIAVAKATTEALERKAILNANLSRNMGFSGHPDAKKAMDLARNELIERDAWMRHLASPKDASIKPLRNSRRILERLSPGLTQRLKHLKIGIQFFPLKSPTKLPVYLCVSSGLRSSRPFGVCLGLGAAPSKSKALEKAALESLRYAGYWLSGKETKPLSPIAFLNRNRWNPEHAIRLGYHLTFARRFLKQGMRYFALSSELPKDGLKKRATVTLSSRSKPYRYDQIKTGLLKQKSSLIQVAWADHRHALKIQFGPIKTTSGVLLSPFG